MHGLEVKGYAMITHAKNMSINEEARFVETKVTAHIACVTRSSCIGSRVLEVPTRTSYGATCRSEREHIMSLTEFGTSIISRIVDFTAGSPHDLSRLECALSSRMRTESNRDSFRSQHCERWARLISAKTDVCLTVPGGTRLDQSVNVLKDGALARLSGLKKKPEWNGEFVLVQARDPDTGRYACRRLHDGRLISFGEGNLVVVQGLLPIAVSALAWPVLLATMNIPIPCT